MSWQRPATIGEIWQAQVRVAPHVFRTPLRYSAALSERCGAQVWLKLENWQPTGSFKVRGAVNFLMQLSASERAQGLVTASAGNHGLAVGYAAQRLGRQNITVFVPCTTPRAKVNKLRRFPVTLCEVGETYEDAHRAAVAFAETQGAIYVHAYDDARTVAGAGTIGLEILADLPEVDTVLVPVGGGGLIAGIATALKALAPKTRLIGVQPEASPALRDSLRDKVCYEEYHAAPTICDGLAGGIGQIVFEVATRGWIDDVVVVSETAVQRAVAEFAREEQQIVEGAGAVGLAALLEFPATTRRRVVGTGRRSVPTMGNMHVDASTFKNQRVVLVVSGANIDADRLARILHENHDSLRLV